MNNIIQWGVYDHGVLIQKHYLNMKTHKRWYTILETNGTYYF